MLDGWSCELARDLRDSAGMLTQTGSLALINSIPSAEPFDHDTRRIQDWLGHRSIQHTTRYTQLSAAPFKDFWT
jgi:integrase